MCFGSSSLCLPILNVLWIPLPGAGIKEPKILRDRSARKTQKRKRGMHCEGSPLTHSSFPLPTHKVGRGLGISISSEKPTPNYFKKPTNSRNKTIKTFQKKLITRINRFPFWEASTACASEQLLLLGYLGVTRSRA